MRMQISFLLYGEVGDLPIYIIPQYILERFKFSYRYECETASFINEGISYFDGCSLGIL